MSLIDTSPPCALFLKLGPRGLGEEEGPDIPAGPLTLPPPPPP